MLLAALALPMVIGAGLGHAPGDVPSWARPDAPLPPIGDLRVETGGTGDNPACRAEFCQPRVVIPGREQGVDTKGKRTELALAAIDRLRLGPVSSIARAANTAGVRVDYQPPQLDFTGMSRGIGKLNVGLRWRLDAWHGPVWAGAAR